MIREKKIHSGATIIPMQTAVKILPQGPRVVELSDKVLGVLAGKVIINPYQPLINYRIRYKIGVALNGGS